MKRKNLEDSNQSAAWNNAYGAIMRINAFLNLCHEAAINHDTVNWYKYLRNLYVTLSSKMTNDEMKLILDKLDAIEPKIYQNYNALKRNNRIYVDPNIIRTLEMIQVTLQKIADKHNLLIPNEESYFSMMEG
jgi:hypothetical protein